ncbi:hypothetical protein F5B20DRAFT_223057 [Whalleya microplaca]|nr:hypothetical protein F5B20DRAFT_223057 [Whalleya microplaca]
MDSLRRHGTHDATPSTEDDISPTSSPVSTSPNQFPLSHNASHNSLAASSNRSLFSRHFTLSSRHSSSSAASTPRSETNPKGPFGLTTLYQPTASHTIIAHIVFVHGLGGGSIHTWSKDEILWPRDLLPKQEPFHKAAIHTFGYDSDFKKSSTLNIQDFSQSLLNSMVNNPTIHASQCPIVLVGHSMGGLVMKKAFLLAKQTSAYEEIAQRTKAVIFVATPHSGSELAPVLDKIFRISSGLKPYLENLRRNSDTVQSINSEFPSLSQDLMIHSFYETSPLNVAGIRDVMVVPKAEAVLNYPHAQSALLYGDHRSICKFTDVDDHNFIALWQAISACVSRFDGSIARPSSSHSSEISDELSKYLGIWEPPADELFRVRTDRLAGTCQWLSDDDRYERWLGDPDPKVLWVRGTPGSGKSYVAGYVIEQLESARKCCCYYFFSHGDRVKSSMEHFLLSMTWQMATVYPDIQKRLLHICSRDRDAAKGGDYRTLQRKFWEQGILKADLDRDVVWVIDAFDECRSAPELGKFLLRVLEKTRCRIRILVTSRNSHGDYQLSLNHVTPRDIDTEDTQLDIARYLDENEHKVPGSTPQERKFMRERILEKSNGCFLWAILVLKRLAKIVGSRARLRALEEMPPGMDRLYSRIVASMSAKEKDMSKIILTWVACAIRPLTATELKYILERTTMDDIDDIETIISKYCHDLVYVDKNSVVNMRHASARRFLLRRDINSEFSTDLTIQEEAAHKALSMACLEYLNGPEMKAKPKRKMIASSQPRSAFVNYACQAVHEHVNRSSALDSDILRELAAFLKSNVLSWLEYLATLSDLETILQFAQVLKTFLRRKSRVDLLLGDEVVIIDTWATDLVKLVSKFGTQLLMHPESILQLIPPFCPSDSGLFSQFGRTPGAVISVLGLSKTTWDDCLCTLVLSDPQTPSSGKVVRERLHSLGTSDLSFCIGTSIGRIVVFNDKTCLEERAINHGAAVIHLQYAVSGSLLASASKRMIRIWNTETWEQQWQIPLRFACLAVAFVDDDQLLLVALKNNTLLTINLVDQSQAETLWTDILDDPHRQCYHGTSAQFASFNTDLGLLAIGYSCRPVLVYNYDLDTYQVFHHKDGLSEFVEENSNVNLSSMVFSKLPDTSLLAVSYSTSELVLFDTEAGTIQATVSSAFFSRLVSSPDGRTLAAVRMDGAIELYDFETLHKLYRIRPDEGAVAALAFTADSTRFLVIRAGGHHCRIWDPASLYRRDVGHNSVRSPSLGSGSQDGVLEEPDDAVSTINSIACDMKGEHFFLGKDDHSVSVYDSKTGLLDGILLSHVAPIKGIHFATQGPKQLILSVDSAGFLAVNAIIRSKNGWVTEELFTYKATVTGVQQFLCDKSSTHVLVCSNDEATLLSMMTGERVGMQVDCRNQSNEVYVWAQHPTDDALILYITTCTVHIYRWSTMECITSTSNGIRLAENGLTGLQVSTATTIFNGASAVLVTKHAAPGQRGKSVTKCFAGNTLSTESTTVSPLVEFQEVCDIMDMIIGSYRDRVVFLHTDGWICSVKANGLKEGEGILHHFAPPVDWLRTNRDLLIKVSRLGDVLFVVKGEVAIVKRGLGRAALLKLQN